MKQKILLAIATVAMVVSANAQKVYEGTLDGMPEV